ncbi:hypothetical protein FACS1894211_12830 [Clostridia bacterium]|nr:hypothetical protein FACS1894211_12830 [Clostridia bacterium]
MKKAKSIKYIIAAVFMAALAVLGGGLRLPARSAYAAANADVKFDDTNVLDDLQASTVNGQPFDLNAYPFVNGKAAQVINFVEYCYSFRVNMQENYGLYIYVYNPSALNFNTSTLSNKLEMAVEYDADGFPTLYRKFSLQFCSMSTESNYYRLFYKFKVRFIDTERTALLNRLNSNERRYDLSGAELFTVGAANAVDYTIAKTCKFSGYVKGYGPDANAESNLSVQITDLEVLELELHSTNFRPSNVSSAGAGYQNDLSSVYFSVPDTVLSKYGRLQKVMAEWYEFRTAPWVIVTSHADMYNAVKNYVGVQIGGYNSAVGYGLCMDRHNVYYNPDNHYMTYGWVWNVSVGASDIVYGGRTVLLPYLFYSGGTDVKNYSVTSDVLKSWIYGYNKSAYGGYLPIKDGNISRDLFDSVVDSGRIRGYNLREFDADSVDDQFNLLSYDSNHSGWDKFWQFGFGAPPTNGDYANVAPIYPVADGDIVGTDAGIAQSLYMNENDVGTFKTFRAAKKSQGETTFLFRFAHTQYYSEMIEILGSGGGNNKAYRAQETVFLDFDVIQLTFSKDGVYHVIPVVSSPIDIVGAITPPLQPANDWLLWLKILLALVLLIVLLVILAPILPVIISGVVWVVKGVVTIIFFPFKAIGAAVKNKKKKGGGN